MPAGDAEIQIRGYRELMRALALADKDTRRFVQHAFVETGEPVAHDAEALAISRIPRMSLSPRWSLMRVGVTRTLVYVAPKMRGVKTRGPDPRRRPNLANLLMRRAMEPALERNAPRLERTVEAALDRVADHFNAGGTGAV